MNYTAHFEVLLVLLLTQDIKLKLGMPRPHFGILSFTSISFMFNMQYYFGCEDDAYRFVTRHISPVIQTHITDLTSKPRRCAHTS